MSIDLAPTFLQLAGLQVPSRMQGRSLLPIFDGRVTSWRDAFLVEYYSDTVFPRVLNMGYSAVRTDRYKYIQYRDITGMDELYDLQADPYEEHNRFADAQAAELLATMRTRLNGLLMETGYSPQVTTATR